jgi:hypothetical protein
MGLAHIHRTHTHKHRIHTHTQSSHMCTNTHAHTQTLHTRARWCKRFKTRAAQDTAYTHATHTCTHAMELESCQNPTHTKTCFTHAQRFTNTKHHSQTYAFCFRNKYIMFYTYKETYFFNYKKISSKYKLKSSKYKKVTWQTNVLWFTLHNSRWRCWVSLRPPGQSFFSPKSLGVFAMIY